MVRKPRGHGEGSIYQRKEGCWVAEITLEDQRREQFYLNKHLLPVGRLAKETERDLHVTLHCFTWWLEERQDGGVGKR